jgi:hypothetical protein
MIRRSNTGSTLFANVYEVHGNYSPVDEIATDAYSSIKKVSIIHDSKKYSIVKIEYLNNKVQLFAIANDNSDSKARHIVEMGSEKLEWTGAYNLFNKTEK